MSKLTFYFEDIKPIKLQRKPLKNTVAFLIKKENFIQGDISIIFCSDEYLLKINEQYLGHNYYTDIVTFDYVENSVISGDLFISLDRVRDNAKELNIAFKEELNRVIIHGVLHLTGYKDKTEAEKKVMREKENFYLRIAGFKEEENGTKI